MKIICAPDSFKESLSAAEAAQAMAAGIRRTYPDALVDCCPVADGGAGTVTALLSATHGESRVARVMGPLGESVAAQWGLLDGGQLAIIEMAAAAGLALVPAKRRDPTLTSTYGVGQLMAAACQAGAQRAIIGLGDSATNDGGCGMAQAVGVQFFSAGGRRIEAPLTGGNLHLIDRIDVSQRLVMLDHVAITLASDVTNPLTGPNGAARVFAAQKGASPDQVEQLEAGLNHFSCLLQRELGLNLAHVPGAGAAGGLGAGLLAFAGASMASGIDLVLDAVSFASRIAGADLCLTGEGRLDGQSLAGKACLGVARAAARQGVPTVALVGVAGPGAEQALAAGLAGYVVIGPDVAPADSIRHAARLLATAAAEVVGKYA